MISHLLQLIQIVFDISVSIYLTAECGRLLFGPYQLPTVLGGISWHAATFYLISEMPQLVRRMVTCHERLAEGPDASCPFVGTHNRAYQTIESEATGNSRS